MEKIRQFLKSPLNIQEKGHNNIVEPLEKKERKIV